MNSRFKWTVVGSSTCVAVLLLIGAQNGRAVSTDDVYSHLKVYTEVLERIKLEYVEQPDMKSVTLGAIDGLLESVDPFASYLTADQYSQYEKARAASKGGVGLILAKRYGYVAVVDSIPGSPSEKASIATGDLIESINGVATRDMPLAYAEQLLSGSAGTTVDISLLRLRNPDPQRITLTRGDIVLPSVTDRLLPGNVGYVHVTSVAGDRIADAKARIQRLKKEGAQYVVLDLRHCSTGDQANGIGLANLFLDKGEIATLHGQKGEKKEFDAQPENDIWSGPVVVITDRATAGGAEIAAAALLDDKRAPVLGERSYGDASLRETIKMEGGGGAIILSTAKYYSPSGKAIQDSGVTPSVMVAENDTTPEVDEDGNPVPQPAPKSNEDNLLKQAVDLVTGKTTVAALTNDAHAANPSNEAQPPIIQKAPK
jgi:carboxyl-terminal processing protease